MSYDLWMIIPALLSMIRLALLLSPLIVLIVLLLIRHFSKAKNKSDKETDSICPECGTPIIAGKNFCTKCGAKIKKN